MFGTDLVCGVISPPACYAKSGTRPAYAATRSAVQSERMRLRDVQYRASVWGCYAEWGTRVLSSQMEAGNKEWGTRRRGR
eukprot:3361242-Rhodomonas_salina.2